MIMEWGSPNTFQQLSLTTQALRIRPPMANFQPLGTSREARMQSLIQCVRSLEYFEGSHLISTIESRYALVMLSQEIRVLRGSSS